MIANTEETRVVLSEVAIRCKSEGYKAVCWQIQDSLSILWPQTQIQYHTDVSEPMCLLTRTSVRIGAESLDYGIGPHKKDWAG